MGGATFGTDLFGRVGSTGINNTIPKSVEEEPNSGASTGARNINNLGHKSEETGVAVTVCKTAVGAQINR